LLSPYSIETALVMAYAGADGNTREEMSRVLHLSGEDVRVHETFAALQRALDAVVQKSAQAAEQATKYGMTNEAISLAVANRLFGEKDYAFRAAFLELLKTNYNAPFQAMDFKHDSAGATKTINDWVAEQTRQRIRDLIPSGALDDKARLVLVNALCFKASWADPFMENATQPMPFHPGGANAVDVPTMNATKNYGYVKTNGVTVVSIPYRWGEFQLLVILPDDVDGLAKVEAGLTAKQLSSWANLPGALVKLSLPKFKIEPPTLPLGEALQSLGMTTAFDKPPGSANFDRMAPRRPDEYLYISRVFHKTFMNVDEKGTEAAAATAVQMAVAAAIMRPPKIVEVKVDHPFIFAIQHRASGACLFLGHVANPRMANL
jgi:serpin B